MKKHFIQYLNESLKETADIQWPAIQHFNEMSISELQKFFESFDSCDELFEVSEKIDGSQFAIGYDDNGIFVKSKRSGAIYESTHFYSMSKEYGIEVFNGFGDVLSALCSDNTLIDWFKRQYKAYDCKFTIFGEILNQPQPNTLKYKDIKNGMTVVVLFGVCGQSDDEFPLFDLMKINFLISDFARRFSTDSIVFKTKNIFPVFDSTNLHGNKNVIALVSKLNEITNFNSKKRDDDTKKIKAEISKLVDIAYKDICSAISKTESMLDCPEIEGIVVINKNNKAITKFVQPKFRDDNIDNWKEMKQCRKFRKELKTEITSADTTSSIATTLERHKEKMQRIASSLKLDKDSSMIKRQAAKKAFTEAENSVKLIDDIKQIKNLNAAKNKVLLALHLI